MERPEKGISLLQYPSDYCAIDVETTGLDPSFDELIEIAAIRVRGGVPVEKYQSLIKPRNPISSFIAGLTGITNEMVADAPSIRDALPPYLDFIGDDIIVGHNVNFDINFVYDNAYKTARRPLRNNYVDTLRIAYYVLPELKHRRLTDVVEALHVPDQPEHRALADCRAAVAVLSALERRAQEIGVDITAHRHRRRAPSCGEAAERREPVKLSELRAEGDDIDPTSPFFGRLFVFTGALTRMKRQDAAQIVVNMGGSCSDSLSAKTDYLVLGNGDYHGVPEGEKSSKRKKAEALALKGNDIQIISENVFFDMLKM